MVMNIFDYAPDGATELKVDNWKRPHWVNGKDEYWDGDSWIELHSKDYGDWKTIATRPQERKTIQDVLEAFPEWEGGKTDAIAYNKSSDVFNYCFTSYPIADGWEVICTREEYEKARGEKLEEWTHTYEGVKCMIITDKPDFKGDIVIYREDGIYNTPHPDELEPIKPQITKSEVWDMLIRGAKARESKGKMKKVDEVLIGILNKYDVVDESSEVQS